MNTGHSVWHRKYALLLLTWRLTLKWMAWACNGIHLWSNNNITNITSEVPLHLWPHDIHRSILRIPCSIVYIAVTLSICHTVLNVLGLRGNLVWMSRISGPRDDIIAMAMLCIWWLVCVLLHSSNHRPDGMRSFHCVDICSLVLGLDWPPQKSVLLCS